jgi:NADH-quinone oxidoreductase subunit H
MNWLDPLVEALIKAVVAIGFLMISAGLMTLAERKLLGRMQTRYGPIRVGPFGILQPLADGLKMLLKEQIVPANAKLGVYLAAPALSLFVALMAFAVVPVGPPLIIHGKLRYFAVANVNIGLLFLLAVLSLGVYGVVLGAWSSANRYSLLGGLRSGAQMISYELALGLAIIGVVILAGSLSPVDIVNAQNRSGLTWFVLLQPIGFILLVIGGVAETNRAPFDLIEAEQELIGGYFTEYGGMRWGLYMLSEYMNMVTVSALVATLFLGGWVGIGTGIIWNVSSAPWREVIGIAWFLLKVALFLFVYVWLRATLPRIRYDQLMEFGWKILLPLAALNLLLTALYVSLS